MPVRDFRQRSSQELEGGTRCKIIYCILNGESVLRIYNKDKLPFAREIAFVQASALPVEDFRVFVLCRCINRLTTTGFILCC